MIYGLYAMRDTKVGFLTPQIDANDKAASRQFKLALATARAESIMGFCPEDFDLYKIGEFDSEKGTVSPLTVPAMISSGGSLEV